MAWSTSRSSLKVPTLVEPGTDDPEWVGGSSSRDWAYCEPVFPHGP